MPITLRDASGNPAVVKIGDGNPDFRMGFSNSVTWKNLRAYGLIDASVGGDVYNRTNQRMYQYGRSGDVDQAGKAQELKKSSAYYVSLYAANDVNSWFVENGTFVKLRELSLSYRIPTARLGLFGRTPLSGLNLSLVGRNLLTLTDYKGYDPEVGNGVNRLDDFIYPRYRTITGAVELEF